MLQAAFLDCQFLDFRPFSYDGFATAEVDIGGRDVVKALMITLVVVILDESSDLPFKIARQVIVLQQDTVFHGLVPAFYFALSLGMEGCTAHVLHAFVFQPFSQVTGYIT